MKAYEVELVTGAKSGDNKAFEVLYTLYHKKVYALARATVRNESDAEDILQQAFINAWHNLERLNDPAAFNTWIQRITVNLCNSHLRKRNIVLLQDTENESNDTIDIESDEPLPALYAERDDLRVRLGGIIDQLSYVQKQTILLYYFDELKVEEIAQVMQCSTGTVKTRLHLARKSIRAEVEEHERISGQKFYGVTGIATVGLGQLLVQQAEALSLPPAVSSDIFRTIAQSIWQNAADAAVTATAGTAAAAAVTKAVAVPLSMKVILSIALTILIATGSTIAYLSIARPEQLPWQSRGDTGQDESTQEPTQTVQEPTIPMPETEPPGTTAMPDMAIVSPETEAYKAYCEVLKEKTDTLGIGMTDIFNDYGVISYEGVIYAELIDFDNNGLPELMIVWNDGVPFSERLTIYGYNDGLVVYYDIILGGDGGSYDDFEIATSIDRTMYLKYNYYYFADEFDEVTSDYYTVVDDRWVSVLTTFQVSDFVYDTYESVPIQWAVNNEPAAEDDYNAAPGIILGIINIRGTGHRAYSDEDFAMYAPFAYSVYDLLTKLGCG